MGRTASIALLVIAAAAAAWYVARSEHLMPPDTMQGAPANGDQEAPPRMEEADESGPAPPVLRGSSGDAPPTDKETAEPEPSSHAKGMAQVTGRVVDEAGDPEPEVRVFIEDIDGHGARGTTDADGRFSLPAGATFMLGAMVIARDGDRVAARALYFGKKSSAVDIGTMALKDGHFVDVVVRSSCDAVPPASLVVQREAQRDPGTIARTETDAEGCAHLGPFPAGECRIYAFAEGCGRGMARVTLPQEQPTPIDIDVEEGRYVVVTVVDGGTGTPVVGATLEFTERVTISSGVRIQRYLPTPEVAPTDLQGRTTISGLSRSVSLEVAVHAPGRPTVTVQAHGLRMPRIPPDVTDVRIELPALRTVRWPITDKEGAIPPDGTPLTLRSGPQSRWVALPKGARVEDGHIVVDSLLPTYIHGLAVTPNGRIARLFAKNDAEFGTATSFRSPRTIEVAVRYADGAPATGMWASLRGPGNNVVAEPVPLDDAGDVMFRDLYGMKVTVYLSSVEAAWGGTPIGSVDLDVGSGRVDAVLARKREVLLRITLDGQPGVPTPFTAHTWMGMSSTSFPIQVVDREGGLARLDWQPHAPGGTANIGLTTPGWVLKDPTVGLRLEDVGTGPIERTLEFVSGGTIDAEVLMPKRNRVQVLVQRWDEAKNGWFVDYSVQVALPPDGRAKVGPLRAGRYRLVSRAGGGASPAVDVVKGGTASVTFDLSKEAMATGRLEVPAGVDVSQARIQVEGRSYVESRNARQTVWSDGTFRVLLSGTEEVVLRPEHPLLVPAEQGGTVKLRAPREGLVLKLAPGPLITAQLEPEPPELERFGEPRLIAFKGPVTRVAKGRPVPIRIVKGHLTCASLPAGTWTLWLDIRGFVPLTIENVEILPSGVDLGTLSLSRGSSFRVVYKVKEGQSAPRGAVWIRSLSEPTYVRGTNGDLADLVVSGLGAGRYSVRASSHVGGAGYLDEEIEVDGSNTVERIVDLR